MIIPMPQLSRDSFEQAAWPHRRLLYRHALRLARRPDVADDLVQDTYVRAFRAFHTFTPGTNVRAWLLQILRHAFINRYRTERHRHAGVELGSLSAIPEDRLHTDPESTLMTSILPDELTGALQTLPRTFRDVIEAAWLEELSYQEIADRFAIPIGTVMSRIHRGRKLLRASLHEFAASRRLIAAESGARRMIA